ncbi:MAG: hypothetical protein PUD20_11730 [bacterium]|nr:hypothetical protein [bacterium]
MEMKHEISPLIVKQVNRLKQNGLSEYQIADDILIPVSEVEEILSQL